MARTFSQAEDDTLDNAVSLLKISTAYNTPFDATVMQQVAKVAASSGFTKSTGGFTERAKDAPILTLLQFLNYIGEPGDKDESFET
jgi:hypothetical protein